MRKTYHLKNLDCPHCAKKLETQISKIKGVENVSVKYPECLCEVTYKDTEHTTAEEEMKKIVTEFEPDIVVEEDMSCESHDPNEECHCHDHVHSHEHHHEEGEDCHCHDHGDHEHSHEHHHGEGGECHCHDHAHNHAHSHEEGCSCGCGHTHEEAVKEEAPESSLTHKYKIEGIDCAACAAKLEHKFEGVPGISNVSLNFMKSTLRYDCEGKDLKRIESEIEEICAKDEPDAKITAFVTSQKGMKRFRVTGIDCADCAASLEKKITKVTGVQDCSLDFLRETLVYRVVGRNATQVEEEIRNVIKNEEPDAVMTEVKKETVKDVPVDDKGLKIMVVRLVIGALLFAAALITEGTVQMVLSVVSWLILGYDVLRKALRGLGKGQLFDENFLMAIATLAALYLKDYKEAAGVMLFYQVGELLQDMAVQRSRKTIGDLMDIRSDTASVNRNGEWVTVDPSEVAVGEVIRVKPGERVPLDGVVTLGTSSLDTASLTGESVPRDAEEGDEVYSGSVNKTGVLEIRVSKEYGDSTVMRILDLVENQESHKSKQEHFITKFSRIYTPAVVFSAIAVGVIVPFFTGNIQDGIYRACTFLVISCPCALVISIPLSFFAGIGGLGSSGVLVKGADLIDTLSQVQTVVMDKTGTLTTGSFAVTEVTGNKERVLEDAAAAETGSNHPIATGIKEACETLISEEEVTNIKEIAGRGMYAEYKGRKILAGNYKLMQEENISCEEINVVGSVVYVAEDGLYTGAIVLSDTLKKNAVGAIKELREQGKKTVIVSGDRQAIVNETARTLNTDYAYGECMPEDKVNKVTQFEKTGVTAFIGDGVNDAPVLAAADIGFAMGALGSDAAIEAADVVIMDDDPSKVVLAVRAAKRILRIAKENIWFAIGVKILVLILGAFGKANMWMAIFADTGVAMLCILNSLRLLKTVRKS